MEPAKSTKILVIEDEQKLGNALQEGLQAEQYEVALAHTGEEGFYLAQTEIFDLLVLDVMLPGRNGFEILATLRQHGFKTPVLMLYAKGKTGGLVVCHESHLLAIARELPTAPERNLEPSPWVEAFEPFHPWSVIRLPL